MRPKGTRCMEGILALIICGSIFYTAGTWAITRLLGIAIVVLAIFYGYTPLRVYLGWPWTALLCLTLLVWIVNVIRDRSKPRPT
jgi:uncharacterized membrane protein YeiB